MKLTRVSVTRGARMLRKTVVVLFFAWHAVALAVYTIPTTATGGIVDALRAGVLPFVAPYLLFTNQWQTWDLFSPDPMRRMTRYRIEAKLGAELAPRSSPEASEVGWTTIRILEPSNARFWRRTDEFNLVQRLDDGSFNNGELYARYLRAHCAPLGLPEGTPVALTVDYIVPADVPADGDWAQWRQSVMAAEWDRWTVTVAPCPAPDDPAIVPIRFL